MKILPPIVLGLLLRVLSRLLRDQRKITIQTRMIKTEKMNSEYQCLPNQRVRANRTTPKVVKFLKVRTI